MTDPHRPNRYVGQRVAFDHQGRRLVGTVETQTFIGPNPRGQIPDYAISIRGDSGKLLTLPSLVDSKLSFLP